jgi:hypothetical protein
LRLQIPTLAVAAIVADVKRYGLLGRETGMFLIASNDSPRRVEGVAWPKSVGVIRRRDAFGVSGLALARLFEHLDLIDRRVIALVHSHRLDAFLSDVDLTHGFSVEGFVSAIVPNYCRPPGEVSEWGWWRFEEGRWSTAMAPEEVVANFLEIRFDETGIK